MATFGYRGDQGPVHWGQLADEWKVAANGKKQSPIDIDIAQVVPSQNLKSLKYNWQADTQVELRNNGLSPAWYVSPGKHSLLGGPLKESYELVQFHIHFSHDKKHGCEHTVNNVSHQAEIHFVHYKKSYGSFGEAVKHHDGLAVVGAFIDVSTNGEAHQTISQDIIKLSNVKDCKSTTAVKLDLTEYMLAADNFYTYPGSLTTPGCNECVVWILLSEPVLITQEAYNAMTSLESLEGGLMSQPGNYRPVQPVNGRTVQASFDPKKKVIPYDY